MAKLLPIGTYVKVTDPGVRDEQGIVRGAKVYIGRVVGYDMGQTKYEIGARYFSWSDWYFMDGGSWAFPTRVEEITEAEATERPKAAEIHALPPKGE